jgi:hypothetical protein
MASVRKDIIVRARPEDVWTAVRAFGAMHRHLAQGFAVDVRLEGKARLVTFANGSVVRELLVDLDDTARRLAYAAVGGRVLHHNASMQVFADEAEGGARLVWITDLLPNRLARGMRELVELESDAILRTLESGRESQD